MEKEKTKDKYLYMEKQLHIEKQKNRVLSPSTFDTVNVPLPREPWEIPLPPSTPRKPITYDQHKRIELMKYNERQQKIEEQKIEEQKI